MTKPLNMLEFYESILSSLSHQVSEEGYVSRLNSEQIPLPTVVDDKRLILPLPDALADPSDKNVFFHPLKEDITRGPSKILEYLRQTVIEEVGAETGALIYSLLTLAATPELQKTLTPDQSEVLDHIKGANKKTVERFGKILEKMVKGESALIHLYLKRGGKDPKTGEVYRWLTTVTFPLYEAFKEDPKNLLGVTLTQDDQKAIRSVFEYVFPNIDTDHAFSFGSNSNLAPKLSSLLGALRNLRSQTLVILDLLKNTPLFEDETITDNKWIDYVDNLEVFNREILFVPMQKGNEGERDVNETQGVKADLSREENPIRPARPTITESVKREESSESDTDNDQGARQSMNGMRSITSDSLRSRDDRRRRDDDDEYDSFGGRGRRSRDDRYRSHRDDDDDRRYDDRRGRGRDDDDDSPLGSVLSIARENDRFDDRRSRYDDDDYYYDDRRDERFGGRGRDRGRDRGRGGRGRSRGGWR